MNKERGFVKLWRSIDQNELLENDNTALIVFTKLLTRVNRHTGSLTTGRYKLANACNLNPNTLYSALKRLEASTIIQQQSNSSSTTIYICNWDEYQQDVNSSSTVRRGGVNTIQEREREVIDTNVSKAKTPGTDIDEMFTYWQEVIGVELLGAKTKNRYACSNLLKSRGKDGLKKLIEGVAKSHEDRYAPRIADFVQLQQKQNDLITWGRNTIKANKGKVVVL